MTNEVQPDVQPSAPVLVVVPSYSGKYPTATNIPQDTNAHSVIKYKKDGERKDAIKLEKKALLAIIKEGNRLLRDARGKKWKRIPTLNIEDLAKYRKSFAAIIEKIENHRPTCLTKNKDTQAVSSDLTSQVKLCSNIHATCIEILYVGYKNDLSERLDHIINELGQSNTLPTLISLARFQKEILLKKEALDGDFFDSGYLDLKVETSASNLFDKVQVVSDALLEWAKDYIPVYINMIGKITKEPDLNISSWLKFLTKMNSKNSKNNETATDLELSLGVRDAKENVMSCCTAGFLAACYKSCMNKAEKLQDEISEENILKFQESKIEQLASKYVRIMDDYQEFKAAVGNLTKQPLLSQKHKDALNSVLRDLKNRGFDKFLRMGFVSCLARSMQGEKNLSTVTAVSHHQKVDRDVSLTQGPNLFGGVMSPENKVKKALRALEEANLPSGEWCTVNQGALVLGRGGALKYGQKCTVVLSKGKNKGFNFYFSDNGRDLEILNKNGYTHVTDKTERGKVLQHVAKLIDKAGPDKIQDTIAKLQERQSRQHSQKKR